MEAKHNFPSRHLLESQSVVNRYVKSVIWQFVGVAPITGTNFIRTRLM